MHLPKLRRPRYADVAATLALFLALGGVAYATTIAPPNSVDTAAIQNHAVTTPKIATEAVSGDKIAPAAVTHGKLAANSVTGGNVQNDSVHLADLSGADRSGTISFTLAANSCGYLTYGVSGAKVGQAAFLTFKGTHKPPNAILFGPLRVVAAGKIISTACNLRSVQVSVTNLAVRIITLS
ncbi:MAG TPA: hypothetical protein VE442_01805 [Jatrophihabitans sp.]|jgi:hypothetical protein|nr:hypothetical protein [Jatrophihabitans sp.]